METLGARLRYLRKRRGLTQEALADILHVDRSNFPAYESNKRKPDAANITILANYFNVSEEWLKCETPAFQVTLGEERMAEVRAELKEEVATQSFVEEIKATYEKIIARLELALSKAEERERKFEARESWYQEQLGKQLAA